jgi:hypothetical protein
LRPEWPMDCDAFMVFGPQLADIGDRLAPTLSQ